MQTDKIQATAIQITPLRVAVILLTLLTAAIHLQLNFPDVMFLLNGLGFLGLLAALILPLPFARDHRPLVRYAFIAFSLLTAALWAAIGMRVLIGYIATTAEVLLAVLLWLDRERTP